MNSPPSLPLSGGRLGGRSPTATGSARPRGSSQLRGPWDKRPQGRWEPDRHEHETGKSTSGGSKLERGTSVSVEQGLCVNGGWHVIIFLFLVPPTCPPGFPIGLDYHSSFSLTHPPHPENSQNGSMMRPAAPTCVGTLREGPPTRRDLASDTATPFSIEQHFVLQPILYPFSSSLSLAHGMLPTHLPYNGHTGSEPLNTGY